MTASTIRRNKNLCIKLSLALNICVLLYLAVQLWESPSLLKGSASQGLVGEAGDSLSGYVYKRTLNSIKGGNTGLIALGSGTGNGNNSINSAAVVTAAQNPVEHDDVDGPTRSRVAPPVPTTSTSSKAKRPIQCLEKSMSPRTAMRGQYWVLYNYVPATETFSCNETITYTTHCDHTFLDNLGPLAKRWQGPISVAIYTPGTDYRDAVRAVTYYRQCVNESDIISRLVTFHFFFPYKHKPQGLEFLSADKMAKLKADCSKPPVIGEDQKTYRKAHSLIYPVNVGRNVARETANSHYIFPSDIELYPNPGLIPAFLEMVQRGDEKALQRPNPKVFVSSIFEIREGHELPNNKRELLKLLKSNIVIPFHKMVCSQCHAIPKAKEWRVEPLTDDLHVFHIGKRIQPYQHWEPIYIGTHSDPLYDERLSWEGRSDKMTQVI